MGLFPSQKVVPRDGWAIDKASNILTSLFLPKEGGGGGRGEVSIILHS